MTNPSTLGPPAQGPIFVAPPRDLYPAHQVRAFDDTGAAPRPHIAPDPFHGTPRTISAQPVPMEGARQCQAPSLMDVDPRSSPTESGTALVPVPRPDLSLPPGAPSPGCSPSAALAQLPMLAVKEEPIPIESPRTPITIVDTPPMVRPRQPPQSWSSPRVSPSRIPLPHPIPIHQQLTCPRVMTMPNPIWPKNSGNQAMQRIGTSAKAPVVAAAGADAPSESSKGLDPLRPPMASSNQPWRGRRKKGKGRRDFPKPYESQ
ncbi:uncharacterized protein LOC135224839 [Macrobrachium nipponense]|uniref:uncharacterized protein LOC135224839 n=1 Tax=Macrobrachium nipponense TaxID=159736 RepID=UPI0030C7EDD3